VKYVSVGASIEASISAKEDYPVTVQNQEHE
jgi:hypothetical protein